MALPRIICYPAAIVIDESFLRTITLTLVPGCKTGVLEIMFVLFALNKEAGQGAHCFLPFVCVFVLENGWGGGDT